MKLTFLLVLLSCAPLGNKPIHLPPGQDYLVINSGKAHRSCLSKFGGKIISQLDQSAREGMSCLRKLKTPKALKHATDLEKLFAEKKITYLCNEKDYGNGWEGIGANASINSSYDKPELGRIHPYISMNPSYVLGDSDVKGRALPEEYLRELIFHESFHLLGYAHTITPDYPYACEEGCYPYLGGDQALACKICATDYKDITDEKYLADFWPWAETAEYKNELGKFVVLRNALIKKPGSEAHLKKMIESAVDDHLVARALAERLPDKKLRERFSVQHLPEEFEGLKAFSRNLAAAEEELYLRGDFRKAKKLYLNLNTTALEAGMKAQDEDLKVHAILIWDWVLSDLNAIIEKLSETKNKEQKIFEKRRSYVHGLLPKT